MKLSERIDKTRTEAIPWRLTHMKLSDRIDAARTEARPWATAVLAGKELIDWELEACALERDASDAWRSFYIACGVIGLCFAGFLWHTTHEQMPAALLCPKVASLQLDPNTIQAHEDEVTEL